MWDRYSRLKTTFKDPDDEKRKRAKSVSKVLRKARSFKAGRKRISVEMTGVGDLAGQEVTFILAKSLAGRVGWKIMTEDEKLNLRVNWEVLEQVISRIRWEMSMQNIG